jgi:hypothetical protein
VPFYLMRENGEAYPVSMEEFVASGAFESDDRVIAKTVGDCVLGEILISTVFLGINHSFGGSKPVLWETMGFMPSHTGRDTIEDSEDRYTSLEEALAGHKRIARQVFRRWAKGVNPVTTWGPYAKKILHHKKPPTAWVRLLMEEPF